MAREWKARFLSSAQSSLLFGLLAFFLTICYKRTVYALNEIDFWFFLSVMGVIFMHRWRRQHYVDMECQNEKAMVLHSIEYFIGEPVTFQPDQVTVLFFFATTCKASRAALVHVKEIVTKLIQRKHPPHEFQMLGLTQEPMEELEAYQNLGQKIPNFTSLSELQFPIGIENGAMFKAYQLKNNITTYPHCYIVGKDQLLKWHGHPFGSFESALVQALDAPKYNPTTPQHHHHRDKRDKVE